MTTVHPASMVTQQAEILTDWRVRLFNRVALILFGVGITILAVATFLTLPLWQVQQVQTLGWLGLYIALAFFLTTLTFRRSLPFGLRFSTLLALLYGVALTRLLQTGPSAVAVVLLFSMVVFAALFYNLRVSFGMIALSLVTLTAAAALFVFGEWAPAEVSPVSPMVWVLLIVFFAVMASVIAYAFDDFFKKLVRIWGVEQNAVVELRTRQTQLEEQVRERTALLESRARLFSAVAQLTREMSAMQHVEQLHQFAAERVAEEFGYYHVAIFNVDENRQVLKMQSASSEAGKKMVRRGYQRPIDSGSIIGIAAETRKPYYVPDIRSQTLDAQQMELMNNRAELAIPIQTSERLLGVLDVHTARPSGIQEQDIEILSIVAEQIALSMENTRLIEESQLSLRKLEMLYGQRVQQDWAQWLEQRRLQYVYRDGQMRLADDLPAAEPDEVLLRIPLRLQNQQVGSLRLRRRAENQIWTAEEQAALQNITTQLTLALDNARLVQETQRRARQDQIVGNVSARMTESLDLETILKTAVTQIREAMLLHDVTISLENPNPRAAISFDESQQS
ncbi:MAG: hypothetical protein OHK0052_00080 [Anaerolineales bacterium]